MRVQSLNQLERCARIERLGPRSIFAGGEVCFKVRIGVRKAAANRGSKFGCAHWTGPQSAQAEAVAPEAVQCNDNGG